ncbi:tripartite tricarboxylate transporter TctB family protein [Paenibacillus sp. HB172176]|uniref:tripartite tricarboxylate transporter TctB family protein n=1 Tax=Paenibacillus sp. HB172176 TaxID=2493690 RepID=UPI00143B48F3|nr:tripartite tricarboxylate transporter TctB family protein [Paenibacillus sp. HB172176]
MNINRSRDFIEFIVLLALGIGLLLLIPHQIDAKSAGLGMGASTDPQLFPKLIAWAFIVIAAIRFAMALLAKGKSVQSEKTEASSPSQRQVLLGIALLIGYAILMGIVGFVISTILAILGMIYLLGKLNGLKAVAFSVVVALLLWAGFHELLHVPLPEGFIGI